MRWRAAPRAGSRTACEASTTTRLGEGAGPQALADRRAVAAASGERSSSGKLVSHKGGSPRAQARQRAARADESDDDVIARRHPVDPGADLLDDAGGLVPEHRRQAPAPGTVHRQDVAVADGAGGDPDPDLAPAGLGKVHLLDHQRLPRLTANGRPHGPRSAAWIALCGGAGVGLRSSAPRSSVARHLRPAPGR